MAARVAIVVTVLSAVALAGHARAETDPACARYQEPMAYNACLARHGPKANDVAARHGHAAQGRSGELKVGTAAERTRSVWRPTRRRGRVHMEIEVK